MEDLKREEEVILVNEQNDVLGLMPKLEAHEKGLLHRAISILVFNSRGEMLIQQRAKVKYHWAGIWSNTCCSHPRNEESFAEAAERRLFEELGFNTRLNEIFHFIYKAYDSSSGLTEHEYDVVFTGVYDGEIHFNPQEIDAIQWIHTDELLIELHEQPDKYSFWFKIIIEEMLKRNLL